MKVKIKRYICPNICIIRRSEFFKKDKKVVMRKMKTKGLKYIVTDEMILNDLSYLTKLCHSRELEVFLSLYNIYCP